jgi:hypothetical protein
MFVVEYLCYNNVKNGRCRVFKVRGAVSMLNVRQLEAPAGTSFSTQKSESIIVGFWHVAGLKVLKHFRIRKNTA